ncbi:MAG TPA: ferritin-like domain-containing protein [Rickettsiales bacterium]|nr:ferritin-like domain-containing protein [Rickettsiales bacterium]
MKKITSLEEAFIHGLSDIYSAEKQLTKALPKLAKASTHPKLAEGFEQHLQETEGQVERIDQIVEALDIKLQRISCKAMEGLIEEGKETIEEIEAGPVRDVMLIAGAQKVEHYEIATYGSLIAIAKELGYEEAVSLLQDTLKEEKATDEKLNKIAMSDVNKEALREAA